MLYTYRYTYIIYILYYRYIYIYTYIIYRRGLVYINILVNICKHSSINNLTYTYIYIDTFTAQCRDSVTSITPSKRRIAIYLHHSGRRQADDNERREIHTARGYTEKNKDEGCCVRPAISPKAPAKRLCEVHVMQNLQPVEPRQNFLRGS